MENIHFSLNFSLEWKKYYQNLLKCFWLLLVKIEMDERVLSAYGFISFGINGRNRELLWFSKTISVALCGG
jgi:hypothetical protein